MVEHAGERREEDDGRQHLHREDHAELAAVEQAAEDEARAHVDVIEQAHEARGDGVEDVAAQRHLEHDGREGDLQGDAGGDQLPVDHALVVGEAERDADEHRQTEQAKKDVA